MPTNYKSELVGVFGYPVAENPTCVMQEAAFAALNLQWRYLTLEVKPDAYFEPWTNTYTVTPDVDILVNATSIGLFPETHAMPDVNLKNAGPGLLVCDVVPNPPETRFIQAARALGLKTLTGLPMLVYQGAIGFELWTEHKAPEAAMKTALEKAFA